jgi:KAP family P-loop domain
MFDVAVSVDRERDETAVPVSLGSDAPVPVGAFGRGILVDVLAGRLQAWHDSIYRPASRVFWRRLLDCGLGALRRRIPDEPPFSDIGLCHLVHLDGAWGSGKTSLAMSLADELRAGESTRPDGWVVVEFDARAHQRIQPRWWALLNAVHRGAIQELRRRSRRRALALRLSAAYWSLREGRAAYLVPIVGAACVFLLWDAGAFDKGLKDVGETASAVAAILALLATIWGATRAASRWLQTASVGVARQREQTEARSALVTRRFGSLVRRIDQPLAILVNDLDRCEPGFVVDLLEGIQTFWGHVPVAYVIAADGSWLRDSYIDAYSEAASDRHRRDPLLGWRFYDAAFEEIVRIPDRSRSGAAAAFEEIIRRPDPSRSEADGDTATDRCAAEQLFAPLDTPQLIVDALVAAERAKRIGVTALRRSALLRLDAGDVQTKVQHDVSIYVPLLEANPRALKTFLTWYRTDLTTLILEGGHLVGNDRLLKQLALWSVLRTRWPTLAEFLARRPDAFSAVASAVARTHPRDSGTPWDADLAKLLRERDVLSVIEGKGVDVALDESAIRAIVGSQRTSDTPGY